MKPATDVIAHGRGRCGLLGRGRPWPRAALRRGQGGSILIPMAAAIVVGIILLASADIGYMAYLKRELQKTADMAALAGAQRIGPEEVTCSALVTQAVAGIVKSSAEYVAAKGQTDLVCGVWDPGVRAEAPNRLVDTEHWYFTSSGEAVNAVFVTLQARAPTVAPFLSGSRIISAHAVAAMDSPTASFSVGARLADVGNSTLAMLLRTVGVDVESVGLVNYRQLAGAKIQPSGLLAALGIPVAADLDVGEFNALLANTEVSLQRLLDVVVTGVGRDELLGLNLRLVEALGAQIGLDRLLVRLGGAGGPPGLFAQVAGGAEELANGALNIGVDALGLVTAAVGVATGGNAVAVPGVAIKIPGLLDNLLSVRASVIEPPSVAIGGVGATAYNAQVRIGVDLCLGGNCGGVVNGLLGLLGTQVKLPVYVDVGTTKAELTELQCTPEGGAQFRIHAATARICVGKLEGEAFSTSQSCSDQLQDETLVRVLGLLNVRDHLAPPAIIGSQNGLRFPASGFIAPRAEPYQIPSDLELGGTVKGLVDELARVLGNSLGAPRAVTDPPAQTDAAARKMVSYYLGLGTNPLNSLPTIRLGALGQPGAYDVKALAERVKEDYERAASSCLLGIPFLCWKTDLWSKWADKVGHVVTLPLVPRHVASGTCMDKASKGFLGGWDVTTFNTCVVEELVAELQSDGPSGKPNWLQVALGPLLGTIVEPLLDGLSNQVLQPVLKRILGLSLNNTDLFLDSIGCHQARLVH